jgi:hypothetical protein
MTDGKQVRCDSESLRNDETWGQVLGIGSGLVQAGRGALRGRAVSG